MSIEGKMVVFTGKISKPRHEFEELVVQNGGRFGTSVTGSTDYLVVGEKPGSKLAVATQLGTKIVSEQEFLDLLREDDTFAETPLTQEELAELEAHMTTRACKWCGSIHRQFDTVPDYETCPVCEILSKPKCPKCGSDEIVFVTMAKNYYCWKCYVFFDAPHSERVQYTEHIHVLDDDFRCVVCRKAWPKLEKVHNSQVLKNLQELRKERERGRDAQQEAEQRRDKQYQKWFESLSEEQISELRRQTSGTKVPMERN